MMDDDTKLPATMQWEGWKEVEIDSATVAYCMKDRQQAIARMISFLDQ